MIELAYIVGSSYSGSTLLGVLLGQHGQVFNAGEIKALGREETAAEVCSCGETLRTCPFWSSLADLTRNSASRPTRSDWYRLVMGLFRYTPDKTKEGGADSELIGRISLLAFGTDSGGTVLDVSKSLWRLHKLRDEEDLSLRVVWIRKTLPASVASLMKRGRRFWTAFGQALLTDWANKRYLRQQRLAFIEIWYEELVADSANTLNRICEFLDLEKWSGETPRDAAKAHLATGNNGTKLGVKGDGTITVALDTSWTKRLSAGQRRIAISAAMRRGDPVAAHYGDIT
jgi:hypothetical protein